MGSTYTPENTVTIIYYIRRLILRSVVRPRSWVRPILIFLTGTTNK